MVAGPTFGNRAAPCRHFAFMPGAGGGIVCLRTVAGAPFFGITGIARGGAGMLIQIIAAGALLVARARRGIAHCGVVWIIRLCDDRA